MRQLCVWLMCVNQFDHRPSTFLHTTHRIAAALPCCYSIRESHTPANINNTHKLTTQISKPPLFLSSHLVAGSVLSIFSSGEQRKNTKNGGEGIAPISDICRVGLDLETLPRGRQWKHKNRREARPFLWIPLLFGWVWEYFPEGDQHRTKHKKRREAGPSVFR